MNLHLSEIISDIMEPIVETLEGGEEVISSEDLQANLEALTRTTKSGIAGHGGGQFGMMMLKHVLSVKVMKDMSMT